MSALLENTAAKLKLVDDYAFQRVPMGFVTCLGGDKEQSLIDEMVADGILVRRNPEINYGVLFHQLTDAGWKWLAGKRCLQ